jgi:hypothetical protein
MKSFIVELSRRRWEHLTLEVAAPTEAAAASHARAKDRAGDYDLCDWDAGDVCEDTVTEVAVPSSADAAHASDVNPSIEAMSDMLSEIRTILSEASASDDAITLLDDGERAALIEQIDQLIGPRADALAG